MSLELPHPWQKAPTEKIKHSISLLSTKDDFEKSRAFVDLDLGVEELLKTFLIQNEKKTEKLRFFDVINLTKDVAGEKIGGVDFKHILYYHNLRNQIHHDGNGLTVPDDIFIGYAKSAVVLLKTLLDVDLTEELESLLVEIKKRESYSPINLIFKTLNDFSENEEALLKEKEDLAKKLFLDFKLPEFKNRATEIALKHTQAYFKGVDSDNVIIQSKRMKIDEELFDQSVVDVGELLRSAPHFKRILLNLDEPEAKRLALIMALALPRITGVIDPDTVEQNIKDSQAWVLDILFPSIEIDDEEKIDDATSYLIEQLSFEVDTKLESLIKKRTELKLIREKYNLD